MLSLTAPYLINLCFVSLCRFVRFCAAANVCILDFCCYHRFCEWSNLLHTLLWKSGSNIFFLKLQLKILHVVCCMFTLKAMYSFVLPCYLLVQGRCQISLKGKCGEGTHALCFMLPCWQQPIFVTAVFRHVYSFTQRAQSLVFIDGFSFWEMSLWIQGFDRYLYVAYNRLSVS